MRALTTPMLNKKAIVRIKTENAHGLILSIRAEIATKGRRNSPALDSFQINADVETLLFKNSTVAKSKPAKAANTTKLFFELLLFIFAAIKALPWLKNEVQAADPCCFPRKLSAQLFPRPLAHEPPVQKQLQLLPLLLEKGFVQSWV